MTWATLDNGFDWFGAFVIAHGKLISEIWQSGVLVHWFAGVSWNLAYLVRFVFQASFMLLVVVAVFAMVYIVLGSLFRKLLRW